MNYEEFRKKHMSDPSFANAKPSEQARRWRQYLTEAKIPLEGTGGAKSGGRKGTRTNAIRGARGKSTAPRRMGKNTVSSPWTQYSRSSAGILEVLKRNFRLSDCASNYLKARFDPFADFSDGLPCVPNAASPASKRYQTRARGAFEVGTAGVGWISASPFQPTNNGTVGLWTNAAYNVLGYNSAAPNTVVYYSNGPYTVAQLNGNVGVNVQIVGCGLRVKYCGPEIEKGGRVLLARQSTGNSLPANMTIAEITNYQSTGLGPAKRQDECVIWQPDSPDQFAFWTYQDGISNTQQLLILVAGGTPGASWEFELVANWCILGANIEGMVQNEADISAMAFINSAAPAANSTDSPKKQLAEAVEKVKENATNDSTLETVANVLSTGLKIASNFA